jgi:transcription initiation factor IIE alpha subunit
LLNPGLGNYDLIHHATMKFDEGEIVEFLCPVCHADLTANEINKNLAYIIMIDEDGKEYHVFFSKICGGRELFKF